MSNDSTASAVSIQPTAIMGRPLDALGYRPPGWGHSTGDHRYCGHACVNKGKDLRPGLGIYESVIADGKPDPATIDERITHDEPDPSVPDAAWTKGMLVNYLHEADGGSKSRYSKMGKTNLVQIAQEVYDKYNKTAAHKKETAK